MGDLLLSGSNTELSRKLNFGSFLTLLCYVFKEETRFFVMFFKCSSLRNNRLKTHTVANVIQIGVKNR